eukprot:2319405-Pyramimonas_sp.AAC.1
MAWDLQTREGWHRLQSTRTARTIGFPGLPLHPCSSAQLWPLSLAAPRSQSVDMAFQGHCILIVHPC